MRVDVQISMELKIFDRDLQEMDIVELISEALWDVEEFRNVQVYDYKIDMGGANEKSSAVPT